LAQQRRAAALESECALAPSVLVLFCGLLAAQNSSAVVWRRARRVL